jgi:hypothetical protein
VSRESGVPIEQFIQALTSQLDRAQDALRLKAVNRPLTFAVKDLTLDLRSHLEVVGSVVRIRPAGPGDREASMIRLSLTTITRPMIEENTVQLSADPDEPSLKDVLGEDTSEDEQRRLEWAGVHTVSQLRNLQQHSNEETLQKYTQLPVDRLRAALMRASLPRVSRITPERPEPGRGAGGTPLLRIRGQNLVGGRVPEVRIGGEPVNVIRAGERELLVRPMAHQLSGRLEIETEPGTVIETELELAGPSSATTPPSGDGA